MEAPLLSSWRTALASVPRAAPTAAGRDMDRRAESKFVVPERAVAGLLSALHGHVAVVPAGAALIAAYRSLYFDTEDLACFHAHRRGCRLRHKVRIRHYPDRRVSFLEIKLRRGEHDTCKIRRERDFGSNTLDRSDRAFLHAHCGHGDDLVPQAWIVYRRITLIDQPSTERVTIDTHLEMWRTAGHRQVRDVVVVEVKQPRLDRQSRAMRAMREAGWRPGWASKYCAGIVLTTPDIRANRLLGRMRPLTAEGAWTH